MATLNNIPKNSITPSNIIKFATGGYGFARYGMSKYGNSGSPNNIAKSGQTIFLVDDSGNFLVDDSGNFLCSQVGESFTNQVKS